MIRNGVTLFVGIGLPSAAANLARLTHAPDTVLIYESGTIGAKPNVLPLSIGDGELSETADAVVSIPEIFSYWLQGGRIGLGFLGAAQIDKFANINSTVIGDYNKPKVRLPGSGGAQEIAGFCGEVMITLRHNNRAFVKKLDFLTSGGYFEGGDFVFAGKVGTGFDTKLLLDLRARLDGLETPQSPFTKATGLPRLRAHWVHPEIVVQVAFIEWTVHGKLRHSRLLGVRFDKAARDVTRETP